MTSSSSAICTAPISPAAAKSVGAPERAVSLAHAVPPATGAHKTCSIRSAPRGQHDQPVEPERDAAGRRHRRQRGKEILVDRVALAVEASARRDLRLEPPSLLGGVGELAEGVGELDAAGKQLEALGEARIVRL